MPRVTRTTQHTIQPSSQHADDVVRTTENQGYFRPSMGSTHAVRLAGKQQGNLPSVSHKSLNRGKPLNLDKVTRFGSRHLPLQKRMRRITKAVKYLPSIRTVFQYASTIGVYSMNSAHLNSLMHHGSIITNKYFAGAFKAMRGISVAIKGFTFMQQGKNAVLHAARDITDHAARTKTQALLADYDPETRTLRPQKRLANTAKQKGTLKKLKKLLQKDKARLGRSKKQVFFDRLLEIKRLFADATGLLESTLLLAGRFTNTVGSAISVAGLVASTVFLIRSAINTGVQFSALNNLASAKAATNDPLLVALSGHIKQERSIKARQELVRTSVNALTLASHIGSAFTPGALAGFIVAGALGIGSAMGMTAFNMYHQRQLSAQRKQKIPLPQHPEALSTLATTNIGVAERAFLHRLRRSTGAELKTSVQFLRQLGVTESTIKRLQLAPQHIAIDLLKDVLYKDKLVFKGVQLQQTGKTLLHVTGINALGRRIKTSSRWLAHKMKHTLAGHSVSFPKHLPASKQHTTHKKMLGYRPCPTYYLTQRYRGYHLLKD